MLKTVFAAGFAGLGASISIDSRNNNFLASYEESDLNEKDGFDLHVDV